MLTLHCSFHTVKNRRLESSVPDWTGASFQFPLIKAVGVSVGAKTLARNQTAGKVRPCPSPDPSIRRSSEGAKLLKLACRNPFVIRRTLRKLVNHHLCSVGSSLSAIGEPRFPSNRSNTAFAIDQNSNQVTSIHHGV